jgi:hypothetical protein
VVTEESQGGDRSYAEWLREMRGRQEVCEHDWVELGGEDLAYHLTLNGIRDDVRIVGVSECRCCLVVRYVTLVMASRR